MVNYEDKKKKLELLREQKKKIEEQKLLREENKKKFEKLAQNESNNNLNKDENKDSNKKKWTVSNNIYSYFYQPKKLNLKYDIPIQVYEIKNDLDLESESEDWEESNEEYEIEEFNEKFLIDNKLIKNDYKILNEEEISNIKDKSNLKDWIKNVYDEIENANDNILLEDIFNYYELDNQNNNMKFKKINNYNIRNYKINNLFFHKLNNNDTNNYISYENLEDENDFLVKIFSVQNSSLIKEFSSHYKINDLHIEDENIIYGGLDNGLITIWDLREKNLPIFKSKLESRSNSISCKNILLYNNFLYSICFDGTITEWDNRSILEPLNIKYLETESKTIDNETNNFNNYWPCCTKLVDNQLFIGTIENHLIQIELGNNFETTKFLTHKIHKGPITSIDIIKNNNIPNSKQFYLTTSSLDWDINFFKNFEFNSPVKTINKHEEEILKIRTNPNNPYFFISLEGKQKINFWDLKKNKFSPINSINHPNEINYLEFSPEENRIYLLDSEGLIYFMNLTKNKINLNEKEFNSIFL